MNAQTLLSTASDAVPSADLRWKLFVASTADCSPLDTAVAARMSDALRGLQPCTVSPAQTPVPLAFNWGEIGHDLVDLAFSWFVVAFRSVRRLDADVDTLHVVDALAHAEARRSGGLLAYYYGDMEPGGYCLAMCIWNAVSDARRATQRPLHQRAVKLAPSMYESHRLHTYAVSSLAGERRLDFQSQRAH